MAVKTSVGAGPQVVAPVASFARVSMKRDNFAAGGVLPEGDYLVKESNFRNFTYVNKSGATGATTTAYGLGLQSVTKQGNSWVPSGDDQNQNWSIGDPGKYMPSEDGNFCLVAGGGSLPLGSNFFQLYDSMVNAGLPEDQWDKIGAALLVGCVVHITHIKAPDRSALKARSAVGTGVAAPPEDRKFPDTIPVIKNFAYSTWDAKGGAPVVAAPVAAVARPAVAVAQPAAVAEPVMGGASRLAGFIKDVVASNGGTFDITQCRLYVHRKYTTSKIDADTRNGEMAAFDDVKTLASVIASVQLLIEGTNIVALE